MSIHKQHISNVHDSIFSSLSHATTDSIAQRIDEISSILVIGQQQDPSELYIFLQDHLTMCLSPMNSVSTVIQSIFGVQQRSTVECLECRNKTVAKQWLPMWSLSIDSQTTLLQCLTHFCEGYLLDGENKYECLACAKPVQAKISYELVEAAPIITIHLKRFVYDQQTRITKKVDRFINFPEFLDLTSYSNRDFAESLQENKENNPVIYELYAVVIHLGKKAHEGHVFSCIRSPDNLWYKIDDKSVTRVDLTWILKNSNAYMLFYSKVPTAKSHFEQTTLESRMRLSSIPLQTLASHSVQKNRENNEIYYHKDSVSFPIQYFVNVIVAL